MSGIPKQEHDALQRRCRSFTKTLVAFDTAEHGQGVEACVGWLEARLVEAGFSVSIEGVGSPLVVARRAGRGAGREGVFVYNHYDVDEPGEGWSSPPLSLTAREGRWRGLGVGDNKGALAARLAALPFLEDHCAEIVWMIQGQEESGSALARRWFESHTPDHCGVWFEENGWFDTDGTQRVLAVSRTPTGALEAPDRALSSLVLSGLGHEGARRVEHRMMNKSLVPGGCPFQASVPPGTLYLSVGTNDALTRIHAPDESIAEDAVVCHAQQFAALLATFTAEVVR